MGTLRTRCRFSKRTAAMRALTLTALVAAAAAPGATASAGGDKQGCDEMVRVAGAGAGTGTCGGVRPGAVVKSRVGQCTMNFLFRSNGRRYVGTAGHCILNRNDEQSWNRGPAARKANGKKIGRFAYAKLGGEKDFALIQLRDGVSANARMCSFGGPTGTDTSTPEQPVILQHYGQGIGTGQATPAREFAAAQGMPDRDFVRAQGTVAFGDSGGPVTRRGSDEAVGLVVSTGGHFGNFGQADAGTVGITRLAPQLRRAEAQLGRNLSLVTAPPR